MELFPRETACKTVSQHFTLPRCKGKRKSGFTDGRLKQLCSLQRRWAK